MKRKDPSYIPEDSCETAATVFKNVFRSFLDDTIWSVGLKIITMNKMFQKCYENPIKLSFTKKNKLWQLAVVLRKWIWFTKTGPKIYYIYTSFYFLIWCKYWKLIIFCCNTYLPCSVLLFTLQIQYSCTENTIKNRG